MNSNFLIEKLDSENYDVWSIQMRSILINTDQWLMVNGDIKRCAENADKWDYDDQKALANIILCVKPTEITNIKSCKTSAEAWKKLREVHMPCGPLQKVSLYKKLLGCSMSANQSMSCYLTSFVELVDKLAELNIELNEELKVIILLSSLPAEYENFVIAIETRDKLPTFNVLKVKLLEEGARREQQMNQEPSQAVYARVKESAHSSNKAFGNAKHNTKSNEFKGKCFGCGMRGHTIAQCKRKAKQQTNQSVKLYEGDNELSYAVYAATVGVKKDKHAWCVDSGATTHMCCDKNMFISFIKKQEKIMLAADNFTYSQGVGTVKIRTTECALELRDVLFVPSLKMNFYSVSKAMKYRHTVLFKDFCVEIKNTKGSTLLRAQLQDKLFIFYAQMNVPENMLHNMMWHNRYGHINFESLKQIVDNNLVRGLNKIDINSKTNCDTCNKSKICAVPFPKKCERETKQILELVHTDVCGPINVKSVGGARYFLTFIDDFSRMIFIYSIKEKSEVFEKFKTFKNMVENQTQKTIKKLRSDNGTEYTNNKFSEFLKECGIKRQLTVPYTPQQNGVAERVNRTIVEMARSLLVHANLKEELWGEAVHTAVYIRNRAPTKLLKHTTPYEVWYNKKPSVKHLRVFGARAFSLDKTHRGKFSAKGKEYVFVGYSEISKAYRLYDRETRQVIIRRDVKFIENNEGLGMCECKNSTKINDDLARIIVSFNNCNEETEQVESFVSFTDGEDDEVENEPQNDSHDSDSEMRRGPGRPKFVHTGKVGRPRKEYQKLNSLQYGDIETPHTVKEALASEYSFEWEKSMKNEYAALVANNTWSAVDLPRGQKVIGSKWVFRIKRNPDGNIEKFKSRLVAKGCSQQLGLNYWETFSPVIRYETIRMLLAIAVEKELHLHQIDISNAYLNSDLTEEVYIRQPEGFIDSKNPDKVLKLNKAIYGLKQSGREWNSTLDIALKNFGFNPCKSEPCLYVKERDKVYSYIAVYVDDLILACPSEEEVTNIKRKLSSKFKLQDGNTLKFFLGFEVEREGKTGAISVCQKTYIKELLSVYGITSCRPVSTPLDPGFQISCKDKNCSKVDVTNYQSLIGSLMYLAISTRPDIMHAVSLLAQRNQDPHSEHEAGAKHVLRYLSKTVDLKLHYCKNGKPVKGYADADWANNNTDRKSYTGYSFFLAGSAFSWQSKKQDVVALSSTEAEYIALSTAAKEAVYLRRLLKEMGCSSEDPILLKGDNMSAIQISKNPVFHKRTKHIEIKYHYIRDVVERKEIELEYVSTNDNVSDIFTKNLQKQKHVKFVDMLGLKY
uniref:Retrovirus-related Pol polyprotein from transposon TNT 1-94 n=1 Tax=Zeugodacus cucurbitae TaxID=28588 RepID=A0A0A1X768_ZEUCU